MAVKYVGCNDVSALTLPTIETLLNKILESYLWPYVTYHYKHKCLLSHNNKALIIKHCYV